MYIYIYIYIYSFVYTRVRVCVCRVRQHSLYHRRVSADVSLTGNSPDVINHRAVTHARLRNPEDLSLTVLDRELSDRIYLIF